MPELIGVDDAVEGRGRVVEAPTEVRLAARAESRMPEAAILLMKSAARGIDL